MMAHKTVDRTDDQSDDRSPSHVTDDFWVYARRQQGPCQEPTERSGKWLLFVPKEKLDEAWATVKRAAQEGRLGCASKAATARHNPRTIDPEKKPICVYTYGGDDRDDVGRVLRELRTRGFEGRLFWKADSATLAGLYSGSGRRVNRYSSDDF